MKVRKRSRGGVAPTTAKRNDKLEAETQEKRKQALALRLRGMSFAAIGEQLGVSLPAAYRYVKDALAEIPTVEAKALKAQELEKLAVSELATNRRLLDTSKPLTTSAFAKLQLVLARIREQRAKLEGLYAPQEHKVDVTHVKPAAVREMSDDELRRLVSGDFAPLHTNGVTPPKAD